MTREEAKRQFEMNNMAHMNKLTNSFLIDEIYDDFESRICEKCEHWKKTIDTFGECYVGVFCESLTDTPKDFGCNRFERKANE